MTNETRTTPTWSSGFIAIWTIITVVFAIFVGIEITYTISQVGVNQDKLKEDIVFVALVSVAFGFALATLLGFILSDRILSSHGKKVVQADKPDKPPAPTS